MTTPVLEQKHYYPIREVSLLTQVPPYTLRYWERCLHIPHPTRIDGGQRRYTKGDIETIFKIKDMVSRQRLTLAGAKKALTGRRAGRTADTADWNSSSREFFKEMSQEFDEILADMDRIAKGNKE